MSFTRTLGPSGIEVSALGLGCWAIGGPFWRGEQPLGWGDVDDAESIRAIHCALEMGVTFFDTADVYGTGHSERILGLALAGKRDRVVIATKFGNQFDETARQATGSSEDPAYIRQAIRASLDRLQMDYVDLYQLHTHPAPGEVGPILETLDALVSEGLIRAYAWSTDSVEAARAFQAGAHNAAVQHELNVLTDAPAMLAFCEEHGLASVNRTPLAMGLLTGKFSADSQLGTDDVRGIAPEWLKYFADGKPSPEWLALLDAVREILRSEGRTLAQGALAWIWGRSPQTVPIPGFRTVAQVEDNAAALAQGPLTPDQMAEIESLLERSAADAD